MKTLKSAKRRNAFTKSVVLALVAGVGLSMTAPTLQAAKPQYRYVPYYVVYVKHPERNTIFQTFSYWNKSQAQRKSAQVNREYWVKVSPVLGKPFYRDAGTDYVGHQAAGLPDKIFAGITGVNIAKIDLIRKQAVVRTKYYKQRIN